MHIERRTRIDRASGKEVVSYQCQVYVPGTGKRMKKTFPRMGDAKAWGAEIERKIRGSESLSKPSEISVQGLATLYLEGLQLERTRRKRGVGVAKWVSFFGKHKPVRLLTRRDIRAFARHLQDSGYKPSTIGTYMATLKAALSVAVDDELIPVNVAAGHIDGAGKGKRDKVITPLTVGEVDSLVDAVPTLYKAMVWVWPRTGLRLGEILAVRWEDVDLEARKLHVVRQLQEGEFVPPKYGSSRSINLSTETAAVLREWHTASARLPNDLGLVFPGKRGGAMDQYSLARSILKPAAARCGIGGLTPHVFRHTFGSWLVEAGVSVAYVQHQMGHVTLQQTISTYIHDRTNEDSGVADALDSLRAAPTPPPQFDFTKDVA